MSNTRQKGKELERYIAQQLIDKGIDARAYARGDSGAGNKEKTDVSTNAQILGRNAGIEAKNQANANVKSWWEQTKKLETLDYEPVLVYSLMYERFEDAKAIIYLDTLLELMKAASGVETIKTVQIEDRQLLFHVEQARSHIKKAAKLLGDE